MFQIIVSEEGSADFTELQHAKKVAALVSSVFPLLSIDVVETEGYALARFKCGDDIGDPALTVPFLPRNITHSGPPTFTKKVLSDRWLVIGNERDLPEGATVLIHKFGTAPEPVVIGGIVAARPYMRSTGRLVAVDFENARTATPQP